MSFSANQGIGGRVRMDFAALTHYPMTQLVLATMVFLLTHLVPSTALRGKLTSALGTSGYLLLYSAVAFATMGWAVWAYYHASPMMWGIAIWAMSHALARVPSRRNAAQATMQPLPRMRSREW